MANDSSVWSGRDLVADADPWVRAVIATPAKMEGLSSRLSSVVEQRAGRREAGPEGEALRHKHGPKHQVAENEPVADRRAERGPSKNVASWTATSDRPVRMSDGVSVPAAPVRSWGASPPRAGWRCRPR
jgi:hypothetical protein